ncbi:hypothetical protein [Zooshikella harenae]|uniref:PEP-CTERM sorting domain-containing protein n=1 Tax=Zooshikella harenae TaxID=2827238 RepID=A0ABS5ZG63_9GAMM|nr:hypothetical protein [Zooshikella harenae]MBU2712955.1 hypothetical protein [Zooshikella harenae]
MLKKVLMIGRRIFYGVCCFSFCLNSAQAIIIGGDVTGGSAATAGGMFVKLIPPIGNVGDDNFNDPNLYGFDEDQNIIIPSPLTVDIGPSATLPTDTEVASHYIVFDPAPSQHMVGYVDFDAPILAIMTKTSTLADSDFLANVSANYLNPSARGLEGADSVAIDPVLAHRALINFTASSPGDSIRVLTAFSPGGEPDPTPMPVPGVFGLMILGLGLLKRQIK